MEVGGEEEKNGKYLGSIFVVLVPFVLLDSCPSMQNYKFVSA